MIFPPAILQALKADVAECRDAVEVRSKGQVGKLCGGASASPQELSRKGCQPRHRKNRKGQSMKNRGMQSGQSTEGRATETGRT